VCANAEVRKGAMMRKKLPSRMKNKRTRSTDRGRAHEARSVPPPHLSLQDDALDQQIVELVASGFLDKEIADELGISESTVKRRLRFLYARHGVDRRAALVHCLSSVLHPAAAGP
jgi:DNA-binding NarL/FixJ family response regulator